MAVFVEPGDGYLEALQHIIRAGAVHGASLPSIAGGDEDCDAVVQLPGRPIELYSVGALKNSHPWADLVDGPAEAPPHPSIEDLVNMPHSGVGGGECCGCLVGPLNAIRCNECMQWVPLSEVISQLANAADPRPKAAGAKLIKPRVPRAEAGGDLQQTLHERIANEVNSLGQQYVDYKGDGGGWVALSCGQHFLLEQIAELRMCMLWAVETVAADDLLMDATKAGLDEVANRFDPPNDAPQIVVCRCAACPATAPPTDSELRVPKDWWVLEHDGVRTWACSAKCAAAAVVTMEAEQKHWEQRHETRQEPDPAE